MKNKILATIVAFGLVGSASAVDINDNLSITGFIDGSYQNNESDTPTGGSTESQQLGLDEVEIDFLFNVASVSGEIHIDTDNNADNWDIEQAHFSYSLENGVNFTYGRFGSALGFEREDPAGLYTFSRAYGNTAFNLGDVDSYVYDGIAVAYDSDVFSISGAFVNETENKNELGNNDIDLELSIIYTGIENFTIGLGYYFDNEADNASENDVLNIHASTTAGKLFLAAEYSEISNQSTDMDAYMVLADYDISDKFGIAARVSSYEDGTIDCDKITIAPNYSITDSLGVILEYSDVDMGDKDDDLLAVELTFTF